jgi:Fic family protein
LSILKIGQHIGQYLGHFMPAFFDSPRQMEPLLPTHKLGELIELASSVVSQSSALDAVLPPPSRAAVVEPLRQMNSYYSNLIEGHYTHPIDIERALNNNYSADPAKRALQLESRAHIEVQELIDQRLNTSPDVNVCSAAFISWIHREFYSRMPEEFRIVQGSNNEQLRFEPGEFRTQNVQVGNHVAPDYPHLPEFFERFETSYQPERLQGLNRVIAAAASHHRLAWIHPFFDGNGRVTRLFTGAYMTRIGLASHGLWTISRGFARNRKSYLGNLANADEPRRSSLDGRGSLSDTALHEFCRFFLSTALDQIRFMGELLDLQGLERRMAGYIDRRARLKELAPEAAYILRDVLLRGEIPRGEIPRISGRPERTARRFLDQLVKEELLTSMTPKGPVRLRIPAKVVAYYFPRLYPEAVEEELLRAAAGGSIP